MFIAALFLIAETRNNPNVHSCIKNILSEIQAQSYVKRNLINDFVTVLQMLLLILFRCTGKKFIQEPVFYFALDKILLLLLVPRQISKLPSFPSQLHFLDVFFFCLSCLKQYNEFILFNNINITNYKSIVLYHFIL